MFELRIATGIGLACLVLGIGSGCRSVIGPSNQRDWSPDQAVLPYAEFDQQVVRIHNVRNCDYRTSDDYTVNYYDKTCDLNQLKSVDFIMVPFTDRPEGAHTFLSFGFEDGDYVAISIEVRREKGETFSVVQGLMNQYELMYVVGDERDLIQLRSNLRMDDVYLYRAKATPVQARALLVDMLERANKLADEPEYYHLVTNNCTTNIMRHINRVAPGRVPYTYEVLLPGYSDRLAYRLGLIEQGESFERAKMDARINRLAYVHRDSPDFSQLIRR